MTPRHSPREAENVGTLRSPEPQYPSGWCPRHRRPKGPDGTCPLCVRAEGPTRSEHLVVYVIASLALIGGAGLVGWLWHHKDDPVEAPPRQATPTRPPPRRAPPPPDAAAAVVFLDDEPAPRRGRAGGTSAKRPRRHRRRAGAPEAGPPHAGLKLSEVPQPRERQLVVRPVSITMYMTPWCPHCTRARRFLRSQKIPFREVNVAKDKVGARELQRLNPRGSVPTFNIDGRVMVGFSPAALATAVEMARERRASGP